MSLLDAIARPCVILVKTVFREARAAKLYSGQKDGSLSVTPR